MIIKNSINKVHFMLRLKASFRWTKSYWFGYICKFHPPRI